MDSHRPSQRLVREGNRFAQERNIGVLPPILRTCVMSDLILGSAPA